MLYSKGDGFSDGIQGTSYSFPKMQHNVLGLSPPNILICAHNTEQNIIKAMSSTLYRLSNVNILTVRFVKADKRLLVCILKIIRNKTLKSWIISLVNKKW